MCGKTGVPWPFIYLCLIKYKFYFFNATRFHFYVSRRCNVHLDDIVAGDEDAAFPGDAALMLYQETVVMQPYLLISRADNGSTGRWKRRRRSWRGSSGVCTGHLCDCIAWCAMCMHARWKHPSNGNARRMRCGRPAAWRSLTHSARTRSVFWCGSEIQTF